MNPTASHLNETGYPFEQLPDLRQSLQHIEGVKEDVAEFVNSSGVQADASEWIPVHKSLKQIECVRRQIEKLIAKIFWLSEVAGQAMDDAVHECEQFEFRHRESAAKARSKAF